MTAPSPRDSVTPREAGAALARSLEPMTPAEARRCIVGPVAAAVTRIESGSERDEPAA